jgi:hypothetical protein
VLIAALLLAPGLAAADPTGIRAYFSENDVDWNFDDGKREASISEFSFQIEERLDGDTRLGFGFGYMNVSLRSDDDSIDTRRFDAQYLDLFLRQPFTLNDHLEVSTHFNYRYNTGKDDNEEDPANIDWSEAGFEIGLGMRVSRLRVTPYVAYHYVNGDVDADSGSEAFDLEDNTSHGVRIDLYVEKTAYVGVALERGDYSRLYFTFAREY